jgi:hypothetical protein
LCGQDFEFVVYRQNWGEDRVHLHDENGQLFSLPAGWTDVVPLDPFVVIAAGRCPFTSRNNHHRPHRGRSLHPPVYDPGEASDMTAPINRRTTVSGLINEYRRAA